MIDKKCGYGHMHSKKDLAFGFPEGFIFPKEQRTRLSYLNKIRLENNTIREMIKNVVKQFHA